MDSTDIVAVQMTPVGMGAIGVILLAGERRDEVVALLESITRSGRLGAMEVGGVTRVNVHDSAGELMDDALVVRAGVARYELHLHGGLAVMAAALEVLRARGAKILTPEEAAERVRPGVLGPMLEGEVQVGLSRAATLTAVRLLLAQPQALAQWAARWQAWLKDATGQDLWRLQSAAQWLLTRSETLSRLLNPPRVAIIGPPNAGKSTLANALLGRPMAITSDMAGTTRDWVDAPVVFATIPAIGEPIQVAVTLVDTAGIRETADALETASIVRSHEQAADADVIIALFDATRMPAARELELASSRAGCPVVVAVNKTDVAADIPAALKRVGAVAISAKLGTGLDDLRRRVLRALDLADLSEAETFAFTERQRTVLGQVALAGDRETCLRWLETLV